MKFRTVLICLIALLILPLNVQAKTYPVTWDPRGIEQTLGLGGGVDLTATFVSKVTLNNVDLWIVPELQPFVSLNQTHFAVVAANTPYEITLHVSIPYGSQTGLYDGTIHLRVGSKTYPQTLKIELKVVDAAATIGPEGGVVEVTDPDSPIYGTKIVIPSGALDEDTVISLSEGVTVDDPDLIGTPILCSPDGYIFDEEVEITIPLEEPFPSGDTLALMIFNEESGQYEFGGRLTEVWSGDSQVTVNVNHFSLLSLELFKSVVSKLVPEAILRPLLVRLTDAVITGDCSELNSVRQELSELQDYHIEYMNQFVIAHKNCIERCDFVDWVEEGKKLIHLDILDIDVNDSEQVRQLVGEKAISFIVGEYINVMKIFVYLPCTTCYAITSWVNPFFLQSFGTHYVCESLIKFVDLALDELGCEGLAFDLEYRYPISGIIGGIGLSPDDSTLYVAYWTDTWSDKVEWYSAGDPYNFIDDVAYGRCHGDAVVSQNNQYMFTTTYYSNVSRFDLWNSNTQSTLPTTSWPSTIALLPDRSKMVVLSGMDGRNYDMGNDALHIFNISSGNFSPLSTINLSDEPTGQKMAFTDNGAYGYFLTRRQWNSDPAKLQEISMSSLTITNWTNLPSEVCSGIALTDNTLYIADWDNPRILVYDRQTLTPIGEPWTLSSKAVVLAIPPDKSGLYALLPDEPNGGALEVFNLSNGNRIGGYEGLGGLSTRCDIEFNSDGSKVYISGAQGAGVLVLNVIRGAM